VSFTAAYIYSFTNVVSSVSYNTGPLWISRQIPTLKTSTAHAEPPHSCTAIIINNQLHSITISFYRMAQNKLHCNVYCIKTLQPWVISIIQFSPNIYTALCPGQPRWAGTKRDIHPLTPEMCCGSLTSFWILWGVGKIKTTDASVPTIRLDTTTSGPSMPHLHHPTNFIPDAFLLQPSQFIFAWYRHQICWIAWQGKNFFSAFKSFLFSSQ